MKTGWKFGLAAVAIAVLGSFWYVDLCSAYPTIYPTGTTIYNPQEAYNGYVLLPEESTDNNNPNARERVGKGDTKWGGELPGKPSSKVRLIDMNGNVVHTWDVTPAGNKRVRLLPNGNIIHVDREPGHRAVYEYNWEGKVVWEYKCPDGELPHHDIRRLPNGNTLLLIENHMPAEYLKKIKDVDVPWWGQIKRSQAKVLGNIIREITPDKKVVWEWKDYENLDVNRFSPVNAVVDWSHGNTISVIPENKWYDEGDQRFKPGNVLYNPRNLDEFYIIDRDTKKIVYSWTYRTEGGLSHCHEVEMIEKGLPGAGNIMLLDNGLFPRHRNRVGQSLILEINPKNKEIVWKYLTVGYSNMKFSTKTRGSVKKLPNGNVFISEDNSGRVFQVKPMADHPEGGEIVWEHISFSDVCRGGIYPYDYAPQMKALPKPKELKVTPPNMKEWHLKPDVER